MKLWHIALLAVVVLVLLKKHQADVADEIEAHPQSRRGRGHF